MSFIQLDLNDIHYNIKIIFSCRLFCFSLSVGRHLVTVLSSSCAWTRWRSLWQPHFDDPRKILGHTHWGWYIWLPCPSLHIREWDPQRQRTHSWWQQCHKCRLLQQNRPGIISEIGWGPESCERVVRVGWTKSSWNCIFRGLVHVLQYLLWILHRYETFLMLVECPALQWIGPQ